MTVGTAERRGAGRGLVRVLVAPFSLVAHARGRVRFLLLAAECLAAAATGMAVWWWVGLWGLPKAGEPFDVRSLEVSSVAVERNVNSVFAEAVRSFKAYGGPKADPGRFDGSRLPMPPEAAAGEWLGANGETLALFRKGSAMPDAGPLGETSSGRDWLNPGAEVDLTEVVRLALTDARRAQGAGDMGAAWDDLIAVLRAARLVGRHSGVFGRSGAGAWRQAVLKALPAWAALPGADAPRLRRALDDVLALEALPPDDVYTLKADYPRAAQGVDQFVGGHDQPIRLADMQLPDHLAEPFFQFRWVLENEPERGRRLVRLAFANWLAYYETPPGRRPRPAVKVLFPMWGTTGRVEFFEPGGEVGPGALARAISPRSLARQVGRSRLARHTLHSVWFWLREVQVQERRDQRELVIALAEALYKRERGTPPPTTDALVGPYLKALPPDGTADLDDGTVPNADD